MTIEYRPAGLTYNAFRAVDFECFPDEPMDEATFQRFLAGDFWAAWDAERFIGYCYLERKPDFAWLRRIGVTGTHRRQAIGRRLLGSAVKHCSGIGLPEMILYVEVDNLPAIRLYEAFGFRPTETTYHYSLDVSLVPQCRSSMEATIEAVPIDRVCEATLPRFPRQWVDIRKMHAPPGQCVLIFLNRQGRELGYCRLTPSFPGCFSFQVAKPHENLLAALASLRGYLLPEKEILKLTFNDPTTAGACDREGFRLLYRLHKMVRLPATDRGAPVERNAEAT